MLDLGFEPASQDVFEAEADLITLLEKAYNEEAYATYNRMLSISDAVRLIRNMRKLTGIV